MPGCIRRLPTFHGRRAARQKSARCRAIEARAAAAGPMPLLASAALAAADAALRQSLRAARRAAASCSYPAVRSAAALCRVSMFSSMRGSGVAPRLALQGAIAWSICGWQRWLQLNVYALPPHAPTPQASPPLLHRLALPQRVQERVHSCQGQHNRRVGRGCLQRLCHCVCRLRQQVCVPPPQPPLQQ